MQSQAKRIYDQALAYALDHKFSVIPIKRDDKKSLVPWLKYQQEIASEGEIKSWFNQFPDMNIGIVTGEVSNICVVDIDEYAEDFDQRGLTDHIPTGIVTPTCHTPRGGRHLFFRHPGFVIRNNVRKLGGCDFRGDGGYVVAAPSQNSDGGKYRWLLSPEDTGLADIPDTYHSMLMAERVSTGGDMFTNGRRDNDLFHVANVLAKGGMPEIEARDVLMQLAANCTPPFSSAEVMAKLNSAYKRNRVLRGDIRPDIDEWIQSRDGVFTLNDIYRDLQILERPDKRLVYKAVEKAEKENLIEKEGTKVGTYRTVSSDIDVIKWWEASGSTVDVKFPLGVDELVKTFPKNIVVIGGAPNSGKTAYVLDFIRMNMKNHDIHYFNSEMAASELRGRLRKYPDLKRTDWRFTAYERDCNFADVIKPDAINVIDYLEIHEEFWKVGSYIKDIHDKLNKGIAVIALQKKPGQEFNTGIGGMFGLQKPRLYMAMDNGRIEIVKGKNWATERRNPNGLSRRFTIEGGWNFKPLSDWRYE